MFRDGRFGERLFAQRALRRLPKTRLEAKRLRSTHGEEDERDDEPRIAKGARFIAEERIDPERKSNDEEENERTRHAHHSRDLTDHEKQPDRGAEKEKGKELLELIHPLARLRQKARRRRNQREEHIGRSEPEGDEGEDEEDHRRFAREGKADGRPEEGRGAGSREDDGQNAFEKGACESVALIGFGAEGTRPDLDLKDAEKVQSKEQKDGGEETGKDRRLELKAPADLRPGRAESDDEDRETHERREDPARIRCSVRNAFCFRLTGETDKAKDLQ